MKGGGKMNKIAKPIILGLVVITVMVAVVSSAFVWHPPVTPNCVA